MSSPDRPPSDAPGPAVLAPATTDGATWATFEPPPAAVARSSSSDTPFAIVPTDPAAKLRRDLTAPVLKGVPRCTADCRRCAGAVHGRAATGRRRGAGRCAASSCRGAHRRAVPVPCAAPCSPCSELPTLRAPKDQEARALAVRRDAYEECVRRMAAHAAAHAQWLSCTAPHTAFRSVPWSMR